MGEQSWRLVNNELMVIVSYMNVHQLLPIFATFTHLYSFPTRSKCVGEALLVGWSCCLVTGSSISAVYVVGWVTLTFKNRHIFAITTDLFAFPMVLPAISGSGRSKMWGRFGWLELLSCWQQQWCHLETLLYRTSGCDEGESQWWPEERWLLRQLKHSRRWAEGRMKGCGRFKLLDRARRYGRYGDWPGGSSCECNRNNMKSLKTKAVERGEGGARAGASFEFFLTTSL